MKLLKVLPLILISLGGLSTFAQTKKPAAKAKPAAAASTDVAASVKRGQVVYASNCLVCHMADGGGIPGMNAPLVKTSYVLGNNQKLINVLLKGMQGVEVDGEEYRNIMPPFSHLTNQQIADVLTYIRNNFGNKAPVVTLKDVSAVRK